MAYVSYSPMRDLHGVRSAVSAPIVARSAFVAIAAAVAILALSEASVSTAGVAASDMVKADRMAAVATVSPAAPAGYFVDAAARTTTVERGASVPLSPESPMAGRAN